MGQSFWGFIILFFVSLSASAQDTWQLSNQLNKDSKDFEALAPVLTRPEANTLEGFLKEWKKEKPYFFSHHLTAYRSRSLQQSDRKNPRAILFNENGDMVLSFNGHPEYRGYSQIEMMRFNHSQNSFEFYELSFDQNKPQLSEANPKKCLECHQSATRQNIDPRPNWEPYSVWLGFYGSLDDSTDLFKSSFKKEPHFNLETDLSLLADFENETAWYDEFLYEILPLHPRYSLLDPINNDYLDERTLNGPFTNRMAVLNFRRVARLMKEQTAIYNKVKWTVWGYAVCGQNFYVNIEAAKWLKKITPRKELEYAATPSPPMPTHCSHNMEFCPHIKNPLPPPKYLTVRASDMINLMYEPFGINTEDWSMDFKSEARFAFAERFGVTNDPRPPLAAAVKLVFGEDPDFKDITCEQVEKRSLKNFGSLAQTQSIYNELLPLAPPPPQRRPLIERCISCHVEPSSTAAGAPPAIPFNNPQELAIALKKTGYKRGTLKDEILYRTGPHAIESEQMPPRGIPTNSERAELTDYLKSLSL